jgi:hypothetical protein
MKILSNEVIALYEDEIEIIYAKWGREFSDNLLFLNDIKNKGLIREFQNVPHTSCLNGIDFPTWFGDFKNKKILFLGIDPMRNNKDFEKSKADSVNDVIIGTPYAFHIRGFRETRTNSYWQVISEVSKSNFVYVTDIYKTFFYTDNTKKIRSYEFWNKAENLSFNQNHRKLLIEEINLIEPDLIITFGALAYKVLTNTKYCPKLSLPLSCSERSVKPFDDKNISKKKSIPILPLMHLSGSTRSEPLERFFKANGLTYSDQKDKRNAAGQLYGKIIKEYIQKINITSP